ncbi:coiled-coil domain-containing protein 40-like [Procambarus clarkii]|uniref:coiled-coil domain-containing protein 40-like n=1 Tax=Procambarus clarkii TaxID=6728 RepID=UPI0037424037
MSDLEEESSLVDDDDDQDADHAPDAIAHDQQDASSQNQQADGPDETGNEDDEGEEVALPSPPPSHPPGGGPSWEAVFKTLGPDHPLLRRFQEAKNKQLLEEKSQLQLRLRQLRQQTEDLRQDNVSLGAQLFGVQQAVTRAQVNLDKAKAERRRTRQAVQAAQDTLLQAREEERTLMAALNNARKHEAEVGREVGRLGSRVAAVKAARTESEGDITTLTRAIHNTAWDRANLEKDKMAQDMLVERVRAAVERESATLAALHTTTREQRDLTHALHTRARLQQQELLQLESESVGVRRAWETNVIMLQRRSQEQALVRQHLHELLAQQAGLRAQVHNTGKAVKDEQLLHEQDSLRLLSLERDVTKQKQRLAVAREETQQLVERHEALSLVVDQLDASCQEKHKEVKEELRRLERVYGRLQAATMRHRRLEDLALDKVGEHTAASRATLNLRRRVSDTRAMCRKLEDELVERERSAAEAALMASDGRAAVITLTTTRDTLTTVVDQLNADVARYEADLRKGQERLSANQCCVDRLNKELAKVLNLTGGSEGPPAEREERRLRLLLEDREKERKALEEEALTMQCQLLETREARDTLANTSSLLHQELSVLRSRQARLEGEVGRERGALREAQQRQERLHRAVATLDARLHQEKQTREATTREAHAAEALLLANLQELEKEVARKEGEVEHLREKKEEVEGQVLEATQERAQLERVLVELRDARDALRKETGVEGDLHAMRTEITRMQARWRTLEATQKELSGQLEQSVSVEGALKTRTLATVEKLRRDPNSAKATRLMHEDILKRKMAKAGRRLRELQAATEAAREERGRLEEEGQRKERLYSQKVRLLQDAATHLEERLVKKQEEQLHLQEWRARLRHLTALRDGRYKTLAAAGEEAQQALRSRLVTRAHAYTGVVTQLEASYPQMEVKLRNIKGLLQNFLE